jgi:hypothetical protein
MLVVTCIEDRDMAQGTDRGVNSGDRAMGLPGRVVLNLARLGGTPVRGLCQGFGAE